MRRLWRWLKSWFVTSGPILYWVVKINDDTLAELKSDYNEDSFRLISQWHIFVSEWGFEPASFLEIALVSDDENIAGQLAEQLNLYYTKEAKDVPRSEAYRQWLFSHWGLQRGARLSPRS